MEGLQVNHLSISFGGVQALKDVSFEVRPGEIVGLIGPNGAGKTSLINCISRYYQPSSGTITFDGANLIPKKPHQLLAHSISRSFQELNLPPNLSVLDNVSLGLHASIRTSVLRSVFDFAYLKREERAHRKRARDIMRFFAEVRLSSERPQEELGFPDITGTAGYPDLLDVQDVPVSMLPYGIKKKVDLARAFVSRPRLLMLDEPAGGLGTADREELIQLILRARKEFNTSILLVEHQMSMIMRLCDRVVVLNFGEKIADGTPDEIKRNPAVIDAYLGKKGTEQPNRPRAPSEAELKRLETEQPILEIKNVDLQYGYVKALSGVSIAVSDRAITAVLGSNGAGKSSLMRAVSGIEHISNGEILFRGQRISHYLQKPRADQIVRQGIIHVAEGRRIFKELSILENLRLAGYTVRNKAQVETSIEKVFHYFPVLKTKLSLRDSGNLSGGQQQMLAIGQALVMEPRVLLLDEPSLGLSPSLVDELFGIIQRITEDEGCAVVLVEQNAEMALRVSTYAYVLETGMVIRQGLSRELQNEGNIKSLYLGG